MVESCTAVTTNTGGWEIGWGAASHVACGTFGLWLCLSVSSLNPNQRFRGSESIRRRVRTLDGALFPENVATVFTYPTS